MFYFQVFIEKLLFYLGFSEFFLTDQLEKRQRKAWNECEGAEGFL